MDDFIQYVRDAVANICNRPDHLQRLSIIGAGMAFYPLLVTMMFGVWWIITHYAVLAAQALAIFGYLSFGVAGLLGLVVVALLGTIKGLDLGAGLFHAKIDLGDGSVTNDATVAAPVAPATVTTTTTVGPTPDNAE